MFKADVLLTRRHPAHRLRPFRLLGSMGLASIVLLVVGWSALWLFARHEANQTFAVWLGEERAQGRLWTCPEQAIGGFPLGIVLSCREPTFKGPVADGIYQGKIAAISADARLYFPTRVTVTLDGPLALQDMRGAPMLQAAWSAAAVTLRGEVPGDLDRGQIDMSDLVVTLPGQNPAANVQHIEASFRPMSQKAVQPFDAETMLVVTDARIPEADTAFGTADPVSASLSTIVTRFQGTAPTLTGLLEPWREAGGQVRVKSFTFAKGGFRAEGDGRIELDEERRLEGRLDTRFSGLEPVAKRFGIPTGAVQIGSALSNLLGGKTAAPDKTSSDLALPLVARDGHLWIGPVKIGVKLDPVY